MTRTVLAALPRTVIAALPLIVIAAADAAIPLAPDNDTSLFCLKIFLFLACNEFWNYNCYYKNTSKRSYKNGKICYFKG